MLKKKATHPELDIVATVLQRIKAVGVIAAGDVGLEELALWNEEGDVMDASNTLGDTEVNIGIEGYVN